MQLKRYEVASMTEAMTKIKNDLGPDAMIMSVKKIRSGKRDLFEVMAARDEDVPLPSQHEEDIPVVKRRQQSEGTDETLISFRRELSEIKQSIDSMRMQNNLLYELAEMKETINSFFDVLGMRKGRVAKDVNSEVYLHLLGNGFSRASACRIVDDVNQSVENPTALKREEALALAEEKIGNSLSNFVGRESGKRIKMFIGPTGVGKTTTLAKLAARYAIVQKKNVGLITMDNFRIAAAEQLGTYAKIMGIPMESASTSEDVQKALRLFSEKDIILVDTPGRARPDEKHLNLMEASQSKNEIETNLLINATGGESYLQYLISSYSRFPVDQLIVTKIDECRQFGMFYDVFAKAKKRVAYVTCGQNVPQDIKEVTSSGIAKLMMGSHPEHLTSMDKEI